MLLVLVKQCINQLIASLDAQTGGQMWKKFQNEMQSSRSLLSEEARPVDSTIQLEIAWLMYIIIGSMSQCFRWQ